MFLWELTVNTGVIDMNHFIRFFVIINIFPWYLFFLLKGLMLCLGEEIYKTNSERIASRERECKEKLGKRSGRGHFISPKKWPPVFFSPHQKRKILLCCSFICSFGQSIQYKSFLICLQRKRFVDSDGNGKPVTWWIHVYCHWPYLLFEEIF